MFGCPRTAMRRGGGERMATEWQKELRLNVREYHADVRQRSINRLKRDFRAIAIAAKLDPDKLTAQDRLNPNGEKLISISDVPSDYQKFLGEFETASPKMRRLGFRLLEIWKRVDNSLFMRVLENSLFDSEGRLKSRDVGTLLQDFHQSLLKEIRTLKYGHKLFIPMEKAERILSISGNKDSGHGDHN